MAALSDRDRFVFDQQIGNCTQRVSTSAVEGNPFLGEGNGQPTSIRM
jgi:hypothetical protein